ncbi:MAG: Zn-ribbon domain-containing OB-fold protein [Candidatus Aenigmarchaeota archaeon]|nr:Zn-ribbon domain-containing OB-fold protein [Candidatus Aenigmarchaeota archaeon]
MVHNSSVPLYWRLRKSKYNLIGTRCKTCSTAYYPARHLCQKCRRKGEIEEFKFSGQGKILSYTIIRSAPAGFERYTPYAVAIIELAEGATISGQVTGKIEDIKIDQPVIPVFRKIYEDGSGGLIHYGIKWEIADGQRA